MAIDGAAVPDREVKERKSALDKSDYYTQLSLWRFVLPKTQIRHMICRLVGWWTSFRYLDSQETIVVDHRKTWCRQGQLWPWQNLAMLRSAGKHSQLHFQFWFIKSFWFQWKCWFLLIVWNSILGFDIHNIIISLMFAPCNPCNHLKNIFMASRHSWPTSNSGLYLCFKQWWCFTDINSSVRLSLTLGVTDTLMKDFPKVKSLASQRTVTPSFWSTQEYQQSRSSNRFKKFSLGPLMAILKSLHWLFAC